MQLLSRLKDVAIGATRYSIDSISTISNTLEIDASLLPLLKMKIGFFNNADLNEEQLRYLLAGFPDLIRNKGSQKAIKKAIYLWFRLNREHGRIINIAIDNTRHIIDITMDAKAVNTTLLDILFEYLLPSGYIITYTFAAEHNYVNNDKFNQNIKIEVIDDRSNSKIKSIADMKRTDGKAESELVSNIGLTRILTADSIDANISPELGE
jgi:hypothetical protein